MSGDHNMYASGSGDNQRSGWRKRTIIELARDCGINFHQAGWPELERFAELVASSEREACAQLCEQYENDMGYGQPQQCANAIRARGQA